MVLLGFYFSLTLGAARHKGLSFDEGEQIAIGYNQWLNRDFRMESANGDLVKRWATLPLLVSRPTFPPLATPYWRLGAPYEVAFLFFFDQGNDPRALLWQCRMMVGLVGVATGLLIFYCSRKLFGDVGGLISLTLFVSSPSMLAFGGIVSTEMTVFLALLGSAWFSGCLLERVTWRTLGASLFFAALLALSKPSAVVMFPVAAILVVVRLLRRRPLIWALGRRREIRSRFARTGVLLGLFVAHVFCGWAAVWTNYGFRYLASPNPSDPGIKFRVQPTDPVDPHVAAFLRWSRREHFLPEGYLHGIEWLLQQNESQAAFMNGQWKYGGWHSFFPYAIWVKVQPPLLLILALSIAGWWMLRRARGRRTGDDDAGSPPEPFFAALPLFALIAVYMTIAMFWTLNIGFRHVLPIFTPLYVLAGATACLWATRHVVLRTAIVILLGWHISGAVGIYPDFLAYFSPVAGGPNQGYKHLVDSSIDWGMDLPEFKRWLEVHNPGDRDLVFFAYFGVDNPDFYHIRSLRLPGRPNWRTGHSYPLAPGIYAISATLLQGMGMATVGPWNKQFEGDYQRGLAAIDEFDRTTSDPAAHAALLAKYPPAFWNEAYAVFELLRFGRLCAWLRHHRPPDDNVGHSILIWRLSKDDIFAAGLGPPAELADRPLQRDVPVKRKISH